MARALSASSKMNDDSGMPRETLWQPVTRRWFFALFGTEKLELIAELLRPASVPIAKL